MKSKDKPWMKSNPSIYNPAKQDFVACAYRLRYIASFVVSARRIANFIHCKWISPVEDGFDCVFSVKDNTLKHYLLAQGIIY